MSEWIPTKWQRKSEFEDMHYHSNLHIDAMLSPCYTGQRFAVRKYEQVLNIKGEWEWEPSPSNRDDVFYQRCRFLTLEAAQIAVEKSEKVGLNDSKLCQECGAESDFCPKCQWERPICQSEKK